MSYNQLQFWLLFAGLMVPYWWLPHRWQNRVLLVASYAFYGFWDYRFLFLILISTVIDFIGGLGVAGVRLSRRRLVSLGAIVGGGALLFTSRWFHDFRIFGATVAVVAGYGLLLPRLYALPEARRRKVFLVISMVANLGILGFFKYCDFFITSFHHVLAAVGLGAGTAPILGVILPAGISFYTFQAMSYTIDIYRGECEPTQDFGDFALFVCFFPHLVAGPIMRAHTLLPQVLTQRKKIAGAFEEGLLLVLIGMFKKIALSDNMAPIANAVFFRLASGHTEGLTGAQVLVGVYAFAFQIYGDFSGYSSIARGISKWLGFELVINFRLPYLAVSPSDFWKRWHISLSTWLRDYLYIPLGGNRGGVRAEYRNLMITMILGGLWHGASWTFVAWGFYHGAILCGFRLARVKDQTQTAAQWLMRVVIMFHLTCLGWLLFRADDFASVTRALALIFGDFHLTAAAFTPLALIAFYALAIFVLELVTEGEEQLGRLVRAPLLAQAAVYAYLLTMILVFHASRAYEFIYFQF